MKVVFVFLLLAGHLSFAADPRLPKPEFVEQTEVPTTEPTTEPTEVPGAVVPTVVPDVVATEVPSVLSTTEAPAASVTDPAEETTDEEEPSSREIFPLADNTIVLEKDFLTHEIRLGWVSRGKFYPFAALKGCSQFRVIEPDQEKAPDKKPELYCDDQLLGVYFAQDYSTHEIFEKPVVKVTLNERLGVKFDPPAKKNKKRSVELVVEKSATPDACVQWLKPKPSAG